MRKSIITLLLAAVALPSAAQQAGQMLGIDQQQTTPSVESPAVLAVTKGFTVGVSLEPGIITSKVNDGYDDVRGRSGMGFAIDVWEVLGEGRGFGFNLLHSATDYDFPGTDKPLSLFYAGVSYVRIGSFGRRWAFNWAIGVGYAHYAIDKLANYYVNRNLEGGGIGIMLRGGIEYLPMKLMGIALDLRDTAHIIPGEDSGGKGLFPGFERLGLNLGLRFHF